MPWKCEIHNSDEMQRAYSPQMLRFLDAVGLTDVFHAWWFVTLMLLVSVSIILASGLSFLGLGASPPNAEWGLMLNTLRQSIYVNTWVPILPGVMIFLTSMAFNLLSDGLRDAMDVRL